MIGGGIIFGGVSCRFVSLRQNQAKDAQTRADIGQIATALSAYFTSSGSSTYPTSLDTLVINKDLTKVPTPPAQILTEVLDSVLFFF